jgi:hypothetical protein
VKIDINMHRLRAFFATPPPAFLMILQWTANTPTAGGPALPPQVIFM